MATVSKIAVQGRFGGDERAERLRVNISSDGEIWSEYPEIFKIDSNDSVIPLEIPVTGKFIRLIPRVTHGRPVCMRTEIYGCYRSDRFSSYSLSILPDHKTPEISLSHPGNTGIGRLSDYKTNEYLKFEPEDGVLEISMDWTQPVNITELLFHVSSRSNSCFKKVTLTSPASPRVAVYRLNCLNRAVGPKIIPLLVSQVLDRLTVRLEFTGILALSEITWSSEVSLKPVRMEVVETEPEVDRTGSQFPEWVTYILAVVGGVVFILIISVFVLVCRKNPCHSSDKTNYGACSYNSASTLRDGTWFNLIPHQHRDTYNTGKIVSNHQIPEPVYPGMPSPDNRNQEIFIKFPSPGQYSPGIPPTLPARRSSESYLPFLPSSGKNSGSRKMEFGHEYSEIGSIAADSGRGESLEGEKTDYAELNYA